MAKLQVLTARLAEPEYLPTPSFGINRALGGYGLASGRIHVYWGSKASGKTTASFHQIATAQKEGKKCLFIDAERAYTPAWAEKCGVDNDALMYIRGNSAEEILRLVLPMMDKEEVDIIVVDSLSSINFDTFFDVTKGDNNPIGSYARSAKSFTHKLLGSLGMKQQVILISHASMDLSNMQYPKLKASIGSAIEHWCSTMVKFQWMRGQKDVRASDGARRVKWTIDKSKQSVYPVSGEYWFQPLTASIDFEAEIVSQAILAEIINKSGAWFKYKDYNWHGEEKAVDSVREEPDLKQELMDLLNGIKVEADGDADDE